MQDDRIYFITGVDGIRTGRSYGRFNGGAEAAEQNRKPGERVEEGRRCPFPGCRGDKDCHPPCGLCYE